MGTTTTRATARTSERVRKDITAAQAEAEAANAQIAALTAATPEVLRTGDDAKHAAHDAEIARMGRVAARCAVRLDDLADELAKSEAREAEDREREEAEAKARRKVEAEAAVQAVVGRIPEGYNAHAEAIAAFLAEWSEAERLAAEHGIPGPQVASGRSVPATKVVTPDREQPFEAYADENGEPSQFAHGYAADGRIDRTKTREVRTFHRTIPGSTRHEGGMVRPGLVQLVNLPKALEDGWHAQGATENQNHARRP
ncbi:hypothetical protein [Methylobacterium sp. GC_Met_2]|uniref:hypothetical protein n=1 Tax=Methylobacterium sp. GC_Met_2 TaxID=2937376 RepID=UPI00226B2D82|nr:hypothetical protein [Methylobacterium sp. GC_Met_2]